MQVVRAYHLCCTCLTHVYDTSASSIFILLMLEASGVSPKILF